MPAKTVTEEITSVVEWIASATRATQPESTASKAFITTRLRLTPIEYIPTFSLCSTVHPHNDYCLKYHFREEDTTYWRPLSVAKGCCLAIVKPRNL